MIGFARRRIARPSLLFLPAARPSVLRISAPAPLCISVWIALAPMSSSASQIKQPKWHKPEPSQANLRVLNSLTRGKEEFIPARSKLVSWYCCGPTVYSDSHMGHARAYITFDILRRIMEDYFGYDINYVMNITDIDDKIILHARYKYLFDQAKSAASALTPELLEDVSKAWNFFVEKRLAKFDPNAASQWDAFATKIETGGGPNPADEPKFQMYFKAAAASNEAIELAKRQIASGTSGQEHAHALLDSSRDVYSLYLDSIKGSTVTDPAIFRDYAAFWENEYFKDMDALNIRRPDVLVRVSEYVPEIVSFVERIISNGFAYQSEGSVYFDTAKFDKHPDHNYAKLEPWSAGNVKLLQEGEGDLSTSHPQGKRNPSDFALWKASKPGEPAWPSPWGEGRPGWHIECSAMAGEILGEKLDIHSGGSDLAFPHHDNEIAQSEGHYNCHQWVNYFIHAGHLHIEGQKMSKSLKNFVKIQEALAKHSATQIRFLFLLHQWNSVLDFKESSMQEARAYESVINNFFDNVKALIQDAKSTPEVFTGNHNFHDLEKKLLASLEVSQVKIHNALCDNFDTPTAMQEIRDLITVTNKYIAEKKDTPNTDLLAKVAKYITRLGRIFGIVRDGNADIGNSAASAAASSDEAIMPYLRALSSFRDGIRELSQKKADHRELLALCDKLRDIDLVELGVALDDREDGKGALVKLVDKELLLKQRQEKLEREQQKQREKEARLQQAHAKKLEKLAKGQTPPEQMFKNEEGLKLYSKWDEKGLPTHDIGGEEISKSKGKKLQKEYDAQVKLHEEYKAFKASEQA
ncbi:tRNA synthetases class I (C) catalytic domain-containing protein [Polychytrium aggregatum]|uniref:tRNA synthetases class I (C) catalytic domain-containing protein n=1 Tax=Polychytrium aggregatum TaxID=110093 RepID=UPI0022FDDF88|nr:tRNA synthetases class I (C) catalytic domain-containing protein [Polychytrium aggregatum]KAI9203862.1 tRNA synthetases class I (C) catalytic domain-containing protein [Polychytrium aggregatum]